MKLVLCLLMLFVTAPVLAAEWRVDRVRGDVTQMVSGQWQTLSRGDLVEDDRLLRTADNGRVGLSRGAETIELQGDTQIRIVDAGPQMMTTVMQDFGTVSIEAERRNVQHFSVQTPFLAAVVKGTRFTVRSDASGASVDVDRGVVQVQDTVNDLVVDVRPGQEATVTSAAPLLVEGAGAVSVYSFTGTPVVNGTTVERSNSSNAGGNGQGNAFGLSKLTDSKAAKASSGAAGDSSNGKSSSSNAGGNGNSGSSNAGGSGGAGNASGNGNSSNAGGNGNSSSGNAGGNGNSGSGNAGGNGNGNSGSSNAGGNGNGNSGSSDAEASGNNAGGNGKGNANGLNKD